MAKGFGAPLGVAEKISERGYINQVSKGRIPTRSTWSLTARVSPGLTFRAVRGVLPRSFPGVLNISATLL